MKQVAKAVIMIIMSKIELNVNLRLVGDTITIFQGPSLLLLGNSE